MAVDALYHELHNIVPHFPDVQEMKARHVVPFAPNIVPSQQQSAASVTEQRASLHDCIQAIDRLFAPDDTFTRWPLLEGPPGSGKTHVLLLARRLGGEHIHLLFRISVLDNTRHTISYMTEITRFHRVRSPVRLTALERIDVLLMEEIGLLSA